MNGHKCYVENGYLFAIALFDEREEDEFHEKMLKELNIHTPKRYQEARICVNTQHVTACYDGLTPNSCIIELTNGYQHRLKASYELIEHLISQT